MKRCAAAGCGTPLTPKQIKNLGVYCSQKCTRRASVWSGRGFKRPSVWAHRREA